MTVAVLIPIAVGFLTGAWWVTMGVFHFTIGEWTQAILLGICAWAGTFFGTAAIAQGYARWRKHAPVFKINIKKLGMGVLILVFAVMMFVPAAASAIKPADAGTGQPPIVLTFLDNKTGGFVDLNGATGYQELESEATLSISSMRRQAGDQVR